MATATTIMITRRWEPVWVNIILEPFSGNIIPRIQERWYWPGLHSNLLICRFGELGSIYRRLTTEYLHDGKCRHHVATAQRLCLRGCYGRARGRLRRTGQ